MNFIIPNLFPNMFYMILTDPGRTLCQGCDLWLKVMTTISSSNVLTLTPRSQPWASEPWLKDTTLLPYACYVEMFNRLIFVSGRFNLISCRLGILVHIEHAPYPSLYKHFFELKKAGFKLDVKRWSRSWCNQSPCSLQLLGNCIKDLLLLSKADLLQML